MATETGSDTVEDETGRPTTPVTDPPWALGFRTQREERATTLPVEGAFPAWLEGTYLVNGPGQFEAGDRALRHWFDPFAMLRRFRIADGEVHYRNRFLDSRDLRFEREHGSVRTMFPGTPADRPLWTRLAQALSGTVLDNPVIGVQRVGEEFLAVTESRWALRIDPDSLATLGWRDRTAGLDAGFALGHVHHDAAEGAFYGLAVDYGGSTRCVLYRRPDVTAGRPEAITTLDFDGDGSPYVHAFALTEHYAVVPATPFGVRPRDLLLGAVTGQSFMDAFGPRDAVGRFHVIDRHTGEQVASPAADPFFIYHFANAYEVDPDGAAASAATDPDTEQTADAIVVDGIAYPDDRAVTGLTLDALRTGDGSELPRGDLVRYRLPLDGGRAERRLVREGPMEFPTIAYRRYNGRPYRYAYVAETDRGTLPTAIAKVTMPEGDVCRYSLGPDAFHGEPMVVPGPDATAEDDAVVLTLVLDGRAGRSVLVCLDAADLTELARAPLPHAVPYAFHGQFYADAAPVRRVA